MPTFTDISPRPIDRLPHRDGGPAGTDPDSYVGDFIPPVAPAPTPAPDAPVKGDYKVQRVGTATRYLLDRILVELQAQRYTHIDIGAAMLKVYLHEQRTAMVVYPPVLQPAYSELWQVLYRALPQARVGVDGARAARKVHKAAEKLRWARNRPGAYVQARAWVHHARDLQDTANCNA